MSYFLIFYLVGYQNKTIADSTAGGYTWCLSTLPTVGVAEDALTLSSWIVTPPEGGLWSVSSVRINTFDSEGMISGDYYYLDDIQCGMFGVVPGWYTATSVDNWAPESANEVTIPFGTGVQIGSDCGAIITFAGQVAGEKSFVINDSSVGGYTWTGNVSPVNLTLKDFAITPPNGGLWSVSSVRINTFDSEGMIFGDYYYLDDIQCGMFGVEPGWYIATSVDNWAPESAGDVSIEAGQMFQIGSDCGATITIPSAIE